MGAVRDDLTPRPTEKKPPGGAHHRRMLPRGNVALPHGTEDELSWTFLTNHGHVLLCIATNPALRISEIADLVGIGERAAQGIVNDLVEGGYLTRTRVGRRNRYRVHGDVPLRHPLERDHDVGELLDALAPLTPVDPPAGQET